MLLVMAAHAIDMIEEARAALARQGFEDIRIKMTGSTVYACLEPTAWRGTFRGAGVAVEEILRLYPDATAIELAITEYKSPQVAVHVRKADDALVSPLTSHPSPLTPHLSVSVDYETAAILKVLGASPSSNSSTGRFDLTVYPMVSIDNHRLDVLCEYIVSIAPSVETTLWQGSRLTLMPVFPIATNVWHEKPDGYIRIGVAALQQELHITDRFRAVVSGGFFMGNQLGGDVTLRYRLGQSFTLGAQATLLGDAYVDDDGYHFEKIDRLSALARISYYHTPTQLEAGLTGGRFVYGDYGARLDVTRHFGEYAIGIFGILTGGEHNAGFHFAIPLGGKRQMRKGAVRLMLPEYFDWEYSMVSYHEYADQKMGRQVETRPDVNHSAHYWQAAYVEQYLKHFLQTK